MKFIIEIDLTKKQERKLRKALALAGQLELITGKRLYIVPEFLENAKLLGVKIKPDNIITRVED